jgi:hypothetical protein
MENADSLPRDAPTGGVRHTSNARAVANFEERIYSLATDALAEQERGGSGGSGERRQRPAK